MTRARRRMATVRRSKPILCVVAVLAYLAMSPMLGHADETPCASYQSCLAAAESKRWAELAQMLLTSAQQLRRVREALRNAERAGDTASAERLRAELTQAEAEWAARQQLADIVTGERYRKFLLGRGNELDAWAARANDALRRKVEQIRALNAALKQQDRSEVQLIETAVQEERAAADAQFWNATLELIRRRIERAREARQHAAPEDAAASASVQPVLVWERLEPVYQKLKETSPAQGADDGTLCAGVAQAGLLLWQEVGRSAPPAPPSAEAEAAFSLAEVSGDLMDLAVVHAHFEQGRQPSTRALSSERQWQLEIDLLGSVAALARAERDRALDDLVHQAGVEDQLKLIRARLNR